LGISFGGSTVVPALTLLPWTLDANGLAEEENDGDRFLVLSRSASDQLNPSPPPDAPILLPVLSRRACAPKLIRRPSDGDAGVFSGTDIRSSSSITAGSSPKLFRNSGEAEPVEVEMLARRCFANALNGEVLLLPARPSDVMDMPRFCASAGKEDGTEEEVGEVETADEDALPGLNISTKDERRLPVAPGEGGGDELAIKKDRG